MPNARPRGFANLTPERRREIAAKGGRAVPKEKRSFSVDPEYARMCGRRGGAAGAHRPKRTYNVPRETNSGAMTRP